METPGGRAALSRVGAILLSVLLAAACTGTSGPATSASSSTRAGATSLASPHPITHPSGAYGVLTNWLSIDNYSVYLVATDGAVVATARATMPAIVNCTSGGNSATPYLPPAVSASNTRAYFMDASGDVRALSPDGSVSSTPVIRLPIGSRRWSFFSVSPDDTEMAVAVVDYGSTAATTSLYIDQLRPGGSQVLTYTQTDSYTLWPVGWHAGELVLAKFPACPGAFGPTYWALELHVVDPATAVRKLTIGGPSCVLAGPPSPAGAVCIGGQGDAYVANWTGAQRDAGPASKPNPIYISPGGTLLASALGTSTNVVSGGVVIGGLNTTVTLNLNMCAWVDDTHVIAAGGPGAAGGPPQQPRIGDVTTGNTAPVYAEGLCAGRIPGAL